MHCIKSKDAEGSLLVLQQAAMAEDKPGSSGLVSKTSIANGKKLSQLLLLLKKRLGNKLWKQIWVRNPNFGFR